VVTKRRERGRSSSKRLIAEKAEELEVTLVKLLLVNITVVSVIEPDGNTWAIVCADRQGFFYFDTHRDFYPSREKAIEDAWRFFLEGAKPIPEEDYPPR
jgi:hypothetical protein